MLFSTIGQFGSDFSSFVSEFVSRDVNVSWHPLEDDFSFDLLGSVTELLCVNAVAQDRSEQGQAIRTDNCTVW